MATFSFRVYSPRWGHEDTYTVVFNRNGIEISQMANNAICAFPSGQDPVWSGGPSSGNPLLDIFEKDQIFAPSVVILSLESAWDRWHSGKASESEVESGLQELFAWIDLVARNKPKGSFWHPVF